MDDPHHIVIDGQHLRRADLVAVARMERSYAWVVQAGKGDAPIYGIMTGFGSLARVNIAVSGVQVQWRWCPPHVPVLSPLPQPE